MRAVSGVVGALLVLTVAAGHGNQAAPPPFRPAVRAGNFIYLSGALAMGADGKIVAGDIAAQTRQALENLRTVLKTNGARIERVAAVTVYLKRASDFAAMNEVYRTYWPTDPPVRTTVVANLVMPEALIEISMVALPDAAERRIVHPAGWVKSPNPYSYGIRSGDTLFTAGLVSRNGRNNTTVAGDITVQTKAALGNAAEILEAGGMTFADVVSARVFLTDTAMFEPMNAAYRSSFPATPPARATVRAGLTAPGYLVEIALIAVRSKDREVVTTPNADGSPGRANPNLSSAVRVGNRLFLSGMLGNTEGNATDARGQTSEALARIGRTLKAGGFGWGHVVDSTVYLADAGRAPQMNDAYRQVLTRTFPARATVEAGLVSPTALVEIMMNAYRD